MRLSCSLALLAILISVESQSLGTTPPVASIPSSGVPVASSPLDSTVPPISSSPALSSPFASPAPSQQALVSTTAPVFAPYSFSPVVVIQPFAPVSQPQDSGTAPSLPTGAWPSTPVAVSLDVCVQEDERVSACTDASTGTCDPSCGNNFFNGLAEASTSCDTIGLVCAALHCCNTCVEETMPMVSAS
ncbi:hypothetical protein MHU86_20958 [Fragilaria crotonensis]|nr:hypothetical protein MHU86_20958 [Fragilaria crotonensis]